MNNIAWGPALGLTANASVEKGVMPLAVLKEVRIPGWVLLGLWICVILRRIALDSLAPLVAMITRLLIIVGELVLFFSGSVGRLQLILVSSAVSMGFAKKRTDPPREISSVHVWQSIISPQMTGLASVFAEHACEVVYVA